MVVLGSRMRWLLSCQCSTQVCSTFSWNSSNPFKNGKITITRNNSRYSIQRVLVDMHTLELRKYPLLKETRLPFFWKDQGKKAIKDWLGYPGRAGRSHPARRRWWSWWWWSGHWTCSPLPGSDRFQLRRTPSHMPLRWTGSGSPQTTDRRWEPRRSGRS